MTSALTLTLRFRLWWDGGLVGTVIQPVVVCHVQLFDGGWTAR